MGNLFNEESGFRLKRLEIYNWGTFDKEIWEMTTDCQTAVLTGANGSGKSTVVDALLTLLIDSRQRNYNLASGAGSGRERSERTYVRGQYSRSRGDSAIESKANTLRDSQSHSVLLAVFYDILQDRTVTLAQVLWISNADRIEKRFYVAFCELCIEKHFPQRHITSRDFPPNLQKEMAIFSSFLDYINHARKALGLNGKPKALSLFNETVSVKDISSLNTFVREHMLDKGNPEERVEALKTQYRELNEAYHSIQRATKQLAILEPMRKASQEYARQQDQIELHEMAQTLVPFYVASQVSGLLNDAIRQVQYDLDIQHSRQTVVDKELTDLRDQLRLIEISIANDNIGQEKREIEGRVTPLKREIEALQRASEKYDTHANLLLFSRYQTETDFYQNRANAEKLLHTLNENIHNLESQRQQQSLEQRDLRLQGEELDKEIRYLRANPSNIPQNVARIRQMISENLGISIDMLPFAGELLKVRQSDLEWEGVLERLLHNFAQDLIVPDSLYRQVSQYVNTQHLQGRLVYHRVLPNQVILHPQSQSKDIMVYEKLEIARHTPHHDWLANHLMQKFAYVCCENLADFQQAERAITRQGQIKHTASRHEKDDRHALNDRTKYVLGWDNRQKLHQLESELDDLSRQIRKLTDQVSKITDELLRHQKDIGAVENLLSYQAFSEIDWRTPQNEYDRLQQRLQELSRQSYQLQQLEKSRDVLQNDIREKERQRDLITGDIRSLKDRKLYYEKQLTQAGELLGKATTEHEQTWAKVSHIIQEVDKIPFSIESFNINNRIEELGGAIQRSISTIKGYITRYETTIIGIMKDFRREYPDEGVALAADLLSLDAFLQIYHRLETDDLPRHQDRFKQMLDRTVSRNIQIFYGNLNEQDREIDKSIAELNDSLAQVDYGGGSIIRLIAERTNDPEISDFIRDLRACFVDVGDNSDEERTRAFNRIKLLIEKFDTDSNWMRRVTDVRRWRIFAAEQIDSDGRQIDYYNDSSGKSGGQKAKLAYTILASAIAHQYGLQDDLSTNRTFRFVVIDEAFSKLDDDNARFAMNLFAQLGLQLLVVTPMQQLHVIESYVQAYHVVVNNNDGNYSRIFNLTQSEYRQRKREFQN